MTGPVPGLPLEQQPGPVISRLNLYAEAQGEGAVGMVGVWWVVEHRAAKRMTRRQDEVLRPAQFSWTADAKATRRAICAHRDDPVVWAVCDTVATLCEAGLVADPTKGATHYYAFGLCHPAWGEGHPGWVETWRHGGHVFGRAA